MNLVHCTVMHNRKQKRVVNVHHSSQSVASQIDIVSERQSKWDGAND